MSNALAPGRAGQGGICAGNIPVVMKDLGEKQESGIMEIPPNNPPFFFFVAS